MNLNKIKNIAVASTMILAISTGCKKDDFAINTNLNEVTSSTVDFQSVLPTALVSTSRIISSDFRSTQEWMGFWARSGNYQSETDLETYSFTNDFENQIWNDCYYNATNYSFIIGKASASGAGFYEAIARIMKAQDFQMLVDVYNNVPYSQAFKGNDNRTPAYDKGEDVYKDLFRQLDTAITILHNADSVSVDKNRGIETNDLVFGGDASMWIKYANTLKLRLLIHCSATTFAADGTTATNSYVPQIDVTGEMAIITAEGSGFLGAGESAHLNPGFTATKPNPYYRTYVMTETGATANFYNYIKASYYALGSGTGSDIGYYGWDGDPRRDRFYGRPSPTSAHRGIPFGEISGFNPGNAGSLLSNLNGPGLLPNGAASRAWLITAAESLFLQAEAAQRGLYTAGGTAEDLLNEAITESFEWLGLDATDADDYITGNGGYPDVDITATGGGMFTILSQKWFALNAIASLEVWNDYRRTDVTYGEPGGFDPGPPISVIAPAGAKIPLRLKYPQNEYNYNAANVLAQTPSGEINVTSDKVFWDLVIR